MSVRSRHFRPPDTLVFNATPMVDVIFLLTIFFMLVSRFSSAEQIPMQLPNPEKSQAQSMHFPQRVTINCRLENPKQPDSDQVLYSIGPNRPQPLSVIAQRLAILKLENPQLQAIVRADKRLTYAAVRECLLIIAETGIEMLNVVAHVAEDGS